MSNGHLSEAGIQQYVLDKTACPENEIAHMHDCEQCLAKAETYRILFSAIKEQPKAVFDFDVSALVLPQISPAEKPEASSVAAYAIACLFVASLSVTGYIYRTQLDKFLKKYIYHLSSGISKGVLYLLITTALTLLIFQSIELFKKYQRKIDDLNFY